MRNINKRILGIAVPAIVSNITVPLLGLVDVAIVGHLGSAAYIGAIAVGGMMFNVVYWLFGFLRMGTSGLTSQALGRRDLAEVMRLLVRSLGVGIAVALCLMALQRPILSLGLAAMQPTAAVESYARAYFRILIWGAPAMLCQFAMTGWFIGMQNSRAPMAVAVTQNVVNILASSLLVFALGMKVEGVAFGTLIAQYAGLLTAVLMWLTGYCRLRSRFSAARLWRWSEMRRFLGVNRDIFLRTLCLVSVMLFFTSAGSRRGETVLAVNTLIMQLYMILSYVMDGFAYAGEALAGKAYGAGNRGQLDATVRSLFLWGGGAAVAFTLVYLLGGDAFFSLLTDERQVVIAVREYSPWAVALPVACVAAFIWDGIFIGCTLTRGMLLSMFLAVATFFVLYLSFSSRLGNHGLWLAFLSYMAVRGLAQTAIWSRKRKSIS